jgi:ribosomal protein S18 acetylase RimI-like enzyme
VELRAAAPADAEGIARVQERGWRVGYAHVFPEEKLTEHRIDAGRWRARLEEPQEGSKTLVVVREGAVAGFVSVGPSRDEPAVGELYAIYVDPEVWGEGVGRELIARAERQLAGDGYLEATLWVLEDNPRARRFYQAAGWSLDGARKMDEHLGLLVPEVRYRKLI